jgi:biotin carboxyl carrier protein
MELTEEDVLQILNLIEKSTFDFVQIELGDLKLVVSKSGHGLPVAASVPPGDSSASPRPAPPARAAKITEESPRTTTEGPGPEPEIPATQDGTVPIRAPMVGAFYTTPQPGVPPFVELGDRVDEDTTVGLIEVMKVFSAVTSGVRGLLAQVCVQNGQLVERGQTLFRVRPDQSAPLLA